MSAWHHNVSGYASTHPTLTVRCVPDISLHIFNKMDLWKSPVSTKHGCKSNREFVQKVDLWKGLGVYITWMCPRAGHCADAGNHTAVGLDQQTGSADKTEQSCLLAIFFKKQIRKGLDGKYLLGLD